MRQKQLLESIDSSLKEAIDQVANAMDLLDQGKDEKAVKALQSATGRFDIALAANPKLALVPVDGYVTVYEINTSIDAIKEQVKQARK